jgi:hypothetical protein
MVIKSRDFIHDILGDSYYSNGYPFRTNHVDYPTRARAVLHISTASPLNDLPTNRVEVDHQEHVPG